MAGPDTKAPDPEITSSSSRQCPSFIGNARTLITHRIGSDVCLQRQREYYHKCHRCIFRGQSADFTPEGSSSANGTTNGVARRGSANR